MKTAILLPCLLAGAHAIADEAWRTLNTTVSGRLQVAKPIAYPCFTSYEGALKSTDDSTCTTVREEWYTNKLRVNNFPSFMHVQSEMCLSEPLDQCMLDNTGRPAGLPSSNSTCRQGSVPSYYIPVTDASDAAVAFKFAEEYGVELSIKNSGHDYMMRNTGKGSLSLWTHNLQEKEFFEDFTPQGCNASVGRSLKLDVGVDANTAHKFAEENGSMLIGPYSLTVTVSGGWVMGGGLPDLVASLTKRYTDGVLAPVYGLGVDRVVEYHIVTPDRVERRVNACQDPDLFFALRGGGGGTFGLVISATHRVEPNIPLAFADIHLPANATAEQALEWIQLQVEESLEWGNTGWGGHVAGTYLTHFNPLPEYTADNGTKAKAAMKRATDFVLSLGGTSDVVVYPNWLAIWEKYLEPANEAGGEVRFGSSRLIPADKFATWGGQAEIMDFFRSIASIGFDPRFFYTPVTTPFTVGMLNKNSKRQTIDRGTSLTPAWYSSLWHLQTSGKIPWNSTYDARLQFVTNLTNATIQSEALSGPDSGTHFNEANPWMSGWQKSYFGEENYERLVGIKEKYDPEGLLKCWKCVGFDDETDIASDRFKCQGKLQQDLFTIFPGLGAES